VRTGELVIECLIQIWYGHLGLDLHLVDVGCQIYQEAMETWSLDLRSSGNRRTSSRGRGRWDGLEGKSEIEACGITFCLEDKRA
jgi:hypothetical protein